MAWSKEQIHLMGTVIDIMIEHEEPTILLNNCVEELKCYEKMFSANSQTSELMAINLQAGKSEVKVHRNLFELIKLGKEHSLPVDSHLNIAIGPLTQAWHIGFEDARVPEQAEITSLLKKINPNRIHLNGANQSIYLEEETSIDLGALAKGYIADLMVADLKRKQVTSGMINLGGNVLVFGNPPNENRDEWYIEVQVPEQSQSKERFLMKVNDKSIVTSGVYERVLKKGNQVYHHIINPSTGYPVDTDVLSLTILSDKSVEGEIWTTRLFGKKAEEMIKEINQTKGIEGIVITKTMSYLSAGIKQYL
ncbi:FAD:protein FMN transferase [Vagococcus carniphilus]|uniref:FAD:protein FMN transferase n=1 Tax=Vagococcus carniphilus TaxID=218144 RepID=A0A430B8X2_9ENTE|nr:FAD:protein FMN transferase [Vagococcus carniphilus]QNN73726.1 FAD:protein FMN transferase [Vagococcus carniphilus]RSU16749.1 thiamine biosynthesis protein ApbE [Vagococcus carniphilus]